MSARKQLALDDPCVTNTVQRLPFQAEETEEEYVNMPSPPSSEKNQHKTTTPTTPTTTTRRSEQLKQPRNKTRKRRGNDRGLPIISQDQNVRRVQQQVTTTASKTSSSTHVGAFHVEGIGSSAASESRATTITTAANDSAEDSRNVNVDSAAGGGEEEPTLIEAHLVKDLSIVHGVSPDPVEPLIRRYRWLLGAAVLIAVVAIVTVLALVLRPDKNTAVLSSTFAPTAVPSQAPTVEESSVPTALLWLQLGQPLMAQNPTSFQSFGSTFAISGNGTILAVMERTETSEFVTTFLYDGDVWNQFGSTIESNTLRDPSLDLSSSGMTLVVGYSANEPTSVVGQVRVFEFNKEGISWDAIGPPINGMIEDDGFGGTIAISGDGRTIAASSFSGIRVFRFDGTEWIQQGNVITDTCGFYDGFGFDIKLSEDGNTLVVGGEECPSGDGRPDSGLLKVFRRFDDSGDWFPKGQDLYGTETGGEFGRSVALSGHGDIIAGSAWKGDSADGTRSRVGYVEVWIYNDSDRSWDRLGEAIYGEEEGEGFGRSMDLSLDGLSLVVGAKYYPGIGEYSGGIKMFRFDGTQWTKIGQTLIGTEANDDFGEAVTISGDGESVVGGALGQIRVFTP